MMLGLRRGGGAAVPSRRHLGCSLPRFRQYCATLTANAPADHPLPAGWVDHPRIKLTRRALYVAVGLTAIGILGAVTSVWMRRTQLEKTTEWFGAETIQAIQILPQVTLELSDPVDPGAVVADAPPVADATAATSDTPVAASTPPAARTIDLSDMPGMGHLRHALLDQRHYDWQQQRAGTVEQLLAQPSSDEGPRQWARLTFTDPRGDFPSGSVVLELSEGWVESGDGQQLVRLVPRAQPAVRHFLQVLSHAEQAHYDRRLRQTQ